MSYAECNLQCRESITIEHIDALYGYALALTHNLPEAEDLVQETFLRSLRAEKNFLIGTNRRAWLLTILRNIWLNKLRRRRISKETSMSLDTEEIAIDMSMNVQEKIERFEQQQRVREAIERLPHKFQEIIFLREYEELSYKEIARILNCHVGTVMSRLGRARGKLRMMLAREMQSFFKK